MIELKTYTDEELSHALNIGVSTLKSKRKITEQRHLKNYEWSRDKKKKVYTINSYKSEAIKNSLEDTFESMLSHFCHEKIPLRNKMKALKIMIVLYKIEINMPSELALCIGEDKQEIHRYINKFKEMDLLVDYGYDHYLVNREDWSWESISQKQSEYVEDYWSRAFFRQIDLRKVSVIEPDMKQVEICKAIASANTESEYGILRKVTHKRLNNEAKAYFGPFLEHAAKELNLFQDE
ncbi:hypothetical protein [Priestia sp. P5]|uniref:hypothetical protein n=1 Tax=Priestia sp. P5 TaxID=2917806 RepID=UPI0024051788|nr:hypothetical protein [Priestia sp. P5]MDG0062104.1 hypothetical protein [Priestia sp. P5]